MGAKDLPVAAAAAASTQPIFDPGDVTAHPVEAAAPRRAVLPGRLEAPIVPASLVTE